MSLIHLEMGLPSKPRRQVHISSFKWEICYDKVFAVHNKLTCTAASKWERYIVTTCLCFLSQSCKKATENVAVTQSLENIIFALISYIPGVSALLTWSCWLSMAILFCSATCWPGLPWWVDEEEVIPRGGDRAPRASFSRKISFDSSVICTKTTRVSSAASWLQSASLPNSHLAVLLLDQALGFLDVLVELLDVAGFGL